MHRYHVVWAGRPMSTHESGHIRSRHGTSLSPINHAQRTRPLFEEPEHVRIDTELVARLVAEQFPKWSALEIEPVKSGGWDNRTFRLGPAMLVRLPSAARYAAQVETEQRWLPKLAPHLPLPIPTPLAMGSPGSGYPWRWSVYRWLDGDALTRDGIADPCGFARDLAQFLNRLHQIDTSGGPDAGEWNFFRGGSPRVYDEETRRAMEILEGRIDAVAVETVWNEALASIWQGPPVWVHGDVAPGNLLVMEGKLCAVIDFGCLCVGDPACDLVIAWTFLSGEARDVFRSSVHVDRSAWVRARGWAVWKALITIAEDREARADDASNPSRVLESVLADRSRRPA